MGSEILDTQKGIIDKLTFSKFGGAPFLANMEALIRENQILPGKPR